MTTERRTLRSHIEEALAATALRTLERLTDDEHGRALREELAQWCETAHQHVRIELRVDKRRGRIDPQSLEYLVWLDTAVGVAPLCRGRVRHLIDNAGQPINARQSARDLLAQLRPTPGTVPAAWTGEAL